MKIGITCYPTYGGSGIVATELGMELAERGHAVHFISYAPPIRLRHGGRNVHFHEVAVTTYPLFAYPPYGLALAARMAEVALNYELDLLHVHYAIPHSVSALVARMMTEAQGRRLPFITTLHGTDITLVGAEPTYFDITRFSIEISDGVTAVSQYLVDRTRAVFRVQSPIRRIPNFINPGDYRPWWECQGLEDRRTRRKRLVHLSNFRPVKRALDCVRVLERVVREVDAELWMAGDGPDRGPAERLTHELGLVDRVRFLGKQDRIPELLEETDVLLLPSELEAFGLAALEAMACGVVPVATRTGGLTELITDGVDGFLAGAGDVERQAELVAALLNDEGRRERMARAARATAESKFSTDLVIPQYERYYGEVLERAGR